MVVLSAGDEITQREAAHILATSLSGVHTLIRHGELARHAERRHRQLSRAEVERLVLTRWHPWRNAGRSADRLALSTASTLTERPPLLGVAVNPLVTAKPTAEVEGHGEHRIGEALVTGTDLGGWPRRHRQLSRAEVERLALRRRSPRLEVGRPKLLRTGLSYPCA